MSTFLIKGHRKRYNQCETMCCYILKVGSQSKVMFKDQKFYIGMTAGSKMFFIVWWLVVVIGPYDFHDHGIAELASKNGIYC